MRGAPTINEASILFAESELTTIAFLLEDLR